MKKGRASKRHHFLRIKSRRIKQNYCGIHDQNGEIDPVRLGRSINTPACCSCAMCNHHRKVFGPGMNETRKLDAAKSQLEEVVV